jgi:hypothetical protein
MEKPTIEHLNRRDYVIEARPFSQDCFRRKNGLDPKLGLCAALVQLWWASVRGGHDGIELLKNADSSLIEDIVHRQLRSYYFGKVPTEAQLDEEAIFWLNAKYGRTDLREIQTLCEKYGASDLLDLDLILEHQAVIIAKHSSSRLTSGFLDAFTLPAEPGLRLLLLRYIHPGHRGGQSGHRMAMAVGSDGGCKFFDPNWGEVTFKTRASFRVWFADFWPISQYRPRIEQPVADILPLRLYRFGFHFPVNADLFMPDGTSIMRRAGNAFAPPENGV